MEIRNTKGINSLNNKPIQQAPAFQKDNTYNGETVTMDTANPNEMLGRSMLMSRKRKITEKVIAGVKQALIEHPELCENIKLHPQLYEKTVGILRYNLSVDIDIPDDVISDNFCTVMANQDVLNNADLVSRLMGVTYSLGEPIFEDFSWVSSENIKELSRQQKENPELFEIALKTSTYGLDFFKLDKYAQIVGDKTHVLNKMVDAATVNGKSRIDFEELVGLLSCAPDIEQQVGVIKDLASRKVSDEKYKYGMFEIVSAVKANAKHNNLDEVLELYDKFSLGFDDIELLSEAIANMEDTSLKDFFMSPEFEKEIKNNSAGKYQDEIVDLLSFKNDDNNSLVNLLKTGLTKEEFLDSLKKISKSAFKLAYERPNQYLSNIDTKYTTLVNGRLPELPKAELEEQRQKVKEFFQTNIGLLAKTLKYLDTDTVSHMMDKRTDLFKYSLDNLNELTNDNWALLSQLTKLKSTKSGKPLSPKEKIQLTQIVQIFQFAKLDKNILKAYVEKGEIDLSEPKQIIQNSILERAGIDISNPDIKINKKKFNEDYSYIALSLSDDCIFENSQIEETLGYIKEFIEMAKTNFSLREQYIQEMEEMQNDLKYRKHTDEEVLSVNKEYLEKLKNADNYSVEEILQAARKTYEVSLRKNNQNNELYNVIKLSVLHDFKEYITDTSNKYGKVNAKTKAEFEKNGLNYEKWLNPEIDDVEFKIAGKTLKLKMWERNPQEDLFIGNKTTCCSAIGATNGMATPVYLLNTSFNVVELYDENGNAVGMSRVFMSNVDGKPALIMDNIELNNTYFKGVDNTEKMKLRNYIFKYMNEYVRQVTGDNNSQVYFYSQDVHVPTEGLEKAAKVTDFIGKLSQETIFINSASCSWLNPENLKNSGEIDWLVVPKNLS